LPLQTAAVDVPLLSSALSDSIGPVAHPFSGLQPPLLLLLLFSAQVLGTVE